MKVPVEHRTHQRFLVRFKSYFFTDGVRLKPGLMRDLSLGGRRLLSVMHDPSGIPIEIHIRPENTPPCISPAQLYVGWIGASAFGVQCKALLELESGMLTRLLWTLRS
jgi:hypothetical protein